jgi:hypothetical protein
VANWPYETSAAHRERGDSDDYSSLMGVSVFFESMGLPRRDGRSHDAPATERFSTQKSPRTSAHDTTLLFLELSGQPRLVTSRLERPVTSFVEQRDDRCVATVSRTVPRDSAPDN